MNPIIQLANFGQNIIELGKKIDFLGLTALRLYLAPILIAAGLHKYHNFDDIVNWFQYGLNMPIPEVMAFLATSTEILGGIAILIGFATRWAAVPLMVTMIVAATTAHWDNGWFAIAPSNPDTSTAKVLALASLPGAEASLENSIEVGDRLSRAKSILKEHGNYDYLTEKGSIVVLNNGIEFAATYLLMLFILFTNGAGKFLSVDHWIRRIFREKK